jgi:hypothetical protein
MRLVIAPSFTFSCPLPRPVSLSRENNSNRPRIVRVFRVLQSKHFHNRNVPSDQFLFLSLSLSLFSCLVQLELYQIHFLSILLIQTRWFRRRQLPVANSINSIVLSVNLHSLEALEAKDDNRLKSSSCSSKIRYFE